MAGTMQELSEAIEAVAAKVAPSVVGVGASGSGFVLAAGLVATNAHNLRAGEDPIVTFADGARRTSTVAGVDVAGDLAVLALETPGVPAIAWSAAPAQLGQLVIAFAHPGGRGVRVSLGNVAALDVGFTGPAGQRIGGAIEHTAPLRHGSSGGPVTDVAGRLLGINTSRQGEGFYRAITADPALQRGLERLARGERAVRPRLGVAVAPSGVADRLRSAVGLPPREGLLVRAVEDGSPGARAGLREGDLIISLAGQAVRSVDGLASLLEAAATSDVVELDVVRGVEELVVIVDLAGVPDED
ncbi:MAG: trypsin-like peptidase domain-containing protein [Actinomycetota bacterium]|nr:trypsin-like peptidase domain-containing protein [Actinomycetota bacterium]